MSLFYVTALIAASLLSGNGNGWAPHSDSVEVATPTERADEHGPLKPANELARLRKIWDGWKEKTTSLEVEGFEFFGIVDAESGQVSRASLLKLIEEDLPTLVKENPKLDLAALNAVTAAIFPPRPKDNPDSATFGRWADISLVRAGDSVKWMMVMNGITMTTIRRGPIEQSHSTGSRQASVFTKNGGLLIPGIDTFICGPTVPSGTRPWQFLETEPTKRQLHVEGDSGKAAQLDYDAVSGSVRYYGMKLSDTRFRKERFQSADVITKNGIPVPRIVTEINYDSKQPSTRRVLIYVVTAVDIGNEIDRTEFNLSVPIGTNVVLFEGAPGNHPPGVRPPMAFTRKVVEDAADFTRSDEFQQAQRK